MFLNDAAAASSARSTICGVKGALLGEDHSRAGALRQELHRRQRERDPPLVEMHLIAEDDALVRHDILVKRVVDMDRAAGRAAADALSPADPEVELVVRFLPRV